MRNLKRTLLGLMLLVFSVSTASATTFTFQPSDVDLYDLEHGHYYTWGIDWSVPEGEAIVGASLFFDNIRNWNSATNDLYVHLFDSAPSGLSAGRDGWQSGSYGDQFSGQGVLLEHYHNLPSYSQDITYNFTDTDLSALMASAADGNFGFGFDPDCHFYNDGVTFSIETAATPIPAPILLLGTGLIGMAGFRKKFKTD